jgi:hypothetical protein
VDGQKPALASTIYIPLHLCLIIIIGLSLVIPIYKSKYRVYVRASVCLWVRSKSLENGKKMVFLHDRVVGWKSCLDRKLRLRGGKSSSNSEFAGNVVFRAGNVVFRRKCRLPPKKLQSDGLKIIKNKFYLQKSQ